ncbi:hypothetical protein PUN28_006145 [Cardiocondyla obscurior]|uniref:Uncharacterized protein n=1 Tax=Cardiocondyla obscurior TaxID=286306 RepID=A0AAW2G9B7_9HYME
MNNKPVSGYNVQWTPYQLKTLAPPLFKPTVSTKKKGNLWAWVYKLPIETQAKIRRQINDTTKKRHRGRRSCRAGRREKARQLLRNFKTPGVFNPAVFPIGPTPAPAGYKTPPQNTSIAPPAVPPPRPSAPSLPQITRIEEFKPRVRIVKPAPVLPIPQAPKTGTSVGTVVQRSSRQINEKWNWLMKI